MRPFSLVVGRGSVRSSRSTAGALASAAVLWLALVASGCDGIRIDPAPGDGGTEQPLIGQASPADGSVRDEPTLWSEDPNDPKLLNGTNGGFGAWTPWRDLSGNGVGSDQESLLLHLFNGVACGRPVGIQCRRISDGMNWFQTGEKASCSLPDGLSCIASQQPDGKCDDYEVRFFCAGSGHLRGFYDSSTPSASNSYHDDESLTRLRSLHSNLCEHPLGVWAGIVSGAPSDPSPSPFLIVTPWEAGLRCIGGAAANQCQDYRVQFACYEAGDGEWTTWIDDDDPSDGDHEDRPASCTQPVAVQCRTVNTMVPVAPYYMDAVATNEVATCDLIDGFHCNNEDQSDGSCQDYAVRFFCATAPRTCNDPPSTTDATCDGIDDDCDGEVDEDYVGHSTGCGVDACFREATSTCIGGSESPACVPGQPTPDDDCDGVNDDCDEDHQADEDYVPLPSECGEGLCAATGHWRCDPGGNLRNDCVPGEPLTCVGAHAGCGIVADGCGGTIDCGGCGTGESCQLNELDERVCRPVVPVPDPATVAPPAPNGVQGTIAEAFGFLVTELIQRDFDSTEFEAHRAAALRGRVLDASGTPLADVRVSVAGAEELGRTYSRADGYFDLLVEGGSTVTLDYEASLHLPAQRTVELGWGDFSRVPDVVLVRRSEVATPIELGATYDQVAVSETFSDIDGTRQIRVVVPAGTLASAEIDGTSVPFDGGHLRITEFTVGNLGEQSMPGTLPEATNYTFAVDYSFDELDPDAEVVFQTPVTAYVTNFLDFDTGLIVPSARYDRASAQWIPEQDGLVIQIVGLTGNMAEIDVSFDGNVSADSDVELSEYGIDDAERIRLATMYPVGTSLIRVQHRHFSPKDYNPSNGRRREKPDPPGLEVEVAVVPDRTCPVTGSIVSCESGGLGEVVPVAGTEHVLRYSSERVEANTSVGRRFTIRFGEQPPDADGMQVRIELLGRSIAVDLDPSLSEYEFVWDGRDAYGRVWNGPVEVVYEIVYEVVPEYGLAVATGRASFQGRRRFGAASCNPSNDPCCVSGAGSSVPVGVLVGYGREGRPARGGAIAVRQRRVLQSTPSNEAIGLGGLGLPAMHALDVRGKVIYRGDGNVDRLEDVAVNDRALLGRTSDGLVSTPTEPTTTPQDSDLYEPKELTVGPDGTLYFEQGGDTQDTGAEIWALTPQNVLVPVLAGTQTPQLASAWSGLGLAAPETYGLQVAHDGSLVTIDRLPVHRVLRLRRTTAGSWSIERLAGPITATGSPTWSDGDPLVGRAMNVVDFAIRRDGTVFLLLDFAAVTGPLADPAHRAIVEVLPDGTGRQVARWDSPDWPLVIGPGPENSILVGMRIANDRRSLVRLDPDGAFIAVLGGGTLPLETTPAPAQQLELRSIREPVAGVDGTIYVASRDPYGVIRVGTDGMAQVIDLPTIEAPSGFTPAPEYQSRPTTGFPHQVAVGPDGRVFISEYGYHRILVHDLSLERTSGGTYRVPSSDGSVIYKFDGSGRHLATIDPSTGVSLIEFDYDGQGRLAAIYDMDGRATTIERPNASTVVIYAPDGPGSAHATTVLALDENGYVDTVTDGRGGIYAFDISETGLLERFWNPRMNAAGVRAGDPYEFTYAPFGSAGKSHWRLVNDQDPLGGSQEFDTTHQVDVQPVYGTWCDGTQYQVGWRRNFSQTTVRHRTPLERETTYVSRRDYRRPVVRTTTEPDGSWRQTQFVDSAGVGYLRVPEMRTDYQLSPDPWLMYGARYTGSSQTVVDAVGSGSGLRTKRTVSVARTRAVTTSAPVPGQYPTPLAERTETTTVNGVRTSTVTYTAATRTIARTSDAGIVWSKILDAEGRVVEARAPGQVPTSFTYNSDGTVASIQRNRGADVRRLSFGYDNRGYLESTTTRISPTHSSTATYSDIDGFGIPESVSIPNAGTLGLDIGVDGALEGVTPPGQPEHRMSYSVLGQLRSYAPPGSTTATGTTCPTGTQCWSYDLDRALDTMTLEDGSAIDASYHATTGQLTSLVVPGDRTYAFGYDAVGRLTSVSGVEAGSVTMGWQASLPIRMTWSGSHTVREDSNDAPQWSGTLDGEVRFFYNDFLEVERVEVAGSAGGPTLFAPTYVRNDDALLTSIQASGGSVPALTVARSAIDQGLDGTTMGVVSTIVSRDVSVTTPGFGDVLSITANVSGVQAFRNEYLYDDAGRIREWTELEGTTPMRTRRFTYDDAGRITHVRDESDVLVEEYAYDGNGNRTRAVTPTQNVELGTNLGCAHPTTGVPMGVAANAEDQLCRYGQYNYVYDGNGRLRTRTSVTDGSVLDLRYDAGGRLREVHTPAGTRIDYVHDALGRRIGRIVNGAFDRGWIYLNGLEPIAELIPDGSGGKRIGKVFVYGTLPHVPDYVVELNASNAVARTLRVVTDHLGSVRRVYDVATGALVQGYDYDTWGNPTLMAGTANVQPFGYAGGLYDAATGLVRFGARDYDAYTGRWTAKDPVLWEGKESNLYGYTEADPVNRIDIEGTFAQVLGAAFGGAVAGAALEVLGQVMRGTPITHLDLSDVGVAAVQGAVNGAIGAATFGAGSLIPTLGQRVLVSGIFGAQVGMLGETSRRILNDEPVRPSDVFGGMAKGATQCGTRGATGGGANVIRNILKQRSIVDGFLGSLAGP